VKAANPWTGHFRALAQKMLPRDDGAIEIWDGNAGRLILQTSWRLPVDASGVRKQSRPVRIVVTREALEDYIAGPPSERLKADQRFQNWLKLRVRRFRPNPSQRVGGPSPDEWVVGPLELFIFSAADAMVIYHLSIKSVSRAKGRLATRRPGRRGRRAAGVRELTTVRLVVPGLVPLSVAAVTAGRAAGVTVERGVAHAVELEFDHGRRRKAYDCRPALPLSVHW
jgi:hypothetical protein